VLLGLSAFAIINCSNLLQVEALFSGGRHEGSKHNLKFQNAMWPQTFNAQGSRLMIVHVPLFNKIS
jgi:hypothetical protein